MATVGVQEIKSGASPTLTFNAASGGGDKFPAGDTTMVIVRNASGVSITPTFTTAATVAAGLAIADESAAVAAGETRAFGPFPGELYRGADGLVAVAWSATTSVTFAVVKPVKT